MGCNRGALLEKIAGGRCGLDDRRRDFREACRERRRPCSTKYMRLQVADRRSSLV
jgi:hypothetical protein